MFISDEDPIIVVTGLKITAGALVIVLVLPEFEMVMLTPPPADPPEDPEPENAV